MNNSKHVKRYLLVDPAIWQTLQTRLKYSTDPFTKNLLKADEELDQALKLEDVSLEDQKRLVSDALQKIQLYKSMGDTNFLPEQILGPAMQRPQKSERPKRKTAADILQTLETPVPRNTSTPINTPDASTSKYESPTQEETRQKLTFQNPFEIVFEHLPEKYKGKSQPILQALSNLPDLDVDPNTMEVSLMGQPIPGSNLTEIVKQFHHSSPIAAEAIGYKKVLNALAEKTSIPPSAIPSPVGQYLLTQQRIKKQKSPQQGFFKGFYEDVKDLPAKSLRSGTRRK